tara:strand:- start:300 stop:467 length:168 start_codon:yes stop_codon:yes gene_type:complete
VIERIKKHKKEIAFFVLLGQMILVSAQLSKLSDNDKPTFICRPAGVGYDIICQQL